jgi:hypothetical protein
MYCQQAIWESYFKWCKCHFDLTFWYCSSLEMYACALRWHDIYTRLCKTCLVHTHTWGYHKLRVAHETADTEHLDIEVILSYLLSVWCFIWMLLSLYKKLFLCRTRSISRSRSRSRSHERKSKKSHKRRSYSRSPSLSPYRKSRKISR